MLTRIITAVPAPVIFPVMVDPVVDQLVLVQVDYHTYPRQLLMDLMDPGLAETPTLQVTRLIRSPTCHISNVGDGCWRQK